MSGAIVRFILSFSGSYLCEWSSSTPGGWFPFGHYTYLPTTVRNELWIGHLPLMDFLSFSFLMVASLGLASLFWRLPVREVFRLPLRRVFPVGVAGVVLFTGIDLVIDPVALRGNRWFLGQIYYYPGGGSYFGVPVANFIGWGVLGLLIVILWRLVGTIFPGETARTGREKDGAIDRWGPVFLWVSVFLFNFSIAVFLGEYRLAVADLLVLGLLFALLWGLRWAWPVNGEKGAGQ